MKVIENQILAHVDEEAIVGFCSDLIKFPSFKTEETPLAEWLADFFDTRGYEVDLQEVERGRFQTIATLKGTGGGKSLMFNGHLDIDSIAYGWKRDPWKPVVIGDKLYGAGSFNMKGGDASMIMAAEAIRLSGIELTGDLVIACVVGELQGGVGTVHLMESGLRTDMAVVTEPFGVHNVVTTHVGMAQLAISTMGFSQHVSRKEDAVDAIGKMMKVIAALDDVRFRFTPHPDLPKAPFITVGGILGGRGLEHDLSGPSFTSDYCTILVDVRYVPGQTLESVIEDIREAIDSVKAEDPELDYKIEQPPPSKFKNGRVVMLPTDTPRDAHIVESVARQYTTLTGNPPKSIGTAYPLGYGATDMSHLWKVGIPTVNYGPEGIEGSLEEPDNCIFVSEMVLATKVLALTASDVCNSTPDTNGHRE